MQISCSAVYPAKFRFYRNESGDMELIFITSAKDLPAERQVMQTMLNLFSQVQFAAYLIRMTTLNYSMLAVVFYYLQI